MNFQEWKRWYKQAGFEKKWFIILVLIRPIIDSFWSLKGISPFYSPLYLAGVLTPVLVIISLLFYKRNSIEKTHLPYFLFSLLIVFNVLIIYSGDPSLNTFGNILKYATPVFLFYYTKNFFYREKDVEGILFTFLLSAIFPLAVLLYEVIINPLNPEFLSSGRGGGARFRGFFADSFTYAIYINGSVLALLYFLFKSKTKSARKRIIKLVIIAGIAFIGLVSIKHTASWVVFGVLISLFFLVQLRSVKGFVIALIFFIMIFPLAGQYIYEVHINPLVMKEFAVIEGDAPIERSFNGRMTRWVQFFSWWDEISIFSKLFGVSISQHPQASLMVSGNTHNDFIRILFLTGIAGLSAYLLFLFSVIRAGIKATEDKAFLFLGSFSIVFLYSVSSMPTLYVSMLYFVLPIFVNSISYSENEKKYSFKDRNAIGQIAPPLFWSGNSDKNHIKFKTKKRLSSRPFQHRFK